MPKDSGIEVKKPQLKKSYTNKLLAKTAGDSGLKTSESRKTIVKDKSSSEFDALTMNSQGKS